MANQNPLLRVETLILIGIGGFVGANARYFITLFYPGLTGTFIANMTGSFLLGFIVYEATYTNLLSKKGRLVISTGFLSSYTTYSTFALETIEATPILGLANVGASYTLGFAGVIAGRQVARQLRGETDD